MTTAIVTGATGLLGGAVVNELVESGVEVHVLVRSGGSNFGPDVTVHEVDLSQPMNTSAFPAEVDKIFHLSQSREFRDFPSSALSTFAVNTVSTAYLLDFARQKEIANFVFASTGGVYKPKDHGIIDEDSPLLAPGNSGFYAGTKLAAEALTGGYASLFVVATLRYFFIYGPGQDRSMLIPRLYDQVKNREAISIQGKNGLTINPVHVADASAATVSAGALRTSVSVNVAGPERISLREIIDLFGRDLSLAASVIESDAASPSLISSTERMSELLAAPRLRLRDSLADIR